MPDGREQSTISYEYDFSAAGNYSVFVPWSELKPTYRGREKDDAPPLNTKHIKRWSFMMRSFFGGQEGDFSVEIKSVKAVTRPEDLEAGFTREKSGHDAVVVCCTTLKTMLAQLTSRRKRSLGHGRTPELLGSQSSSALPGPSARAFAGTRALT